MSESMECPECLTGDVPLGVKMCTACEVERTHKKDMDDLRARLAEVTRKLEFFRPLTTAVETWKARAEKAEADLAAARAELKHAKTLLDDEDMELLRQLDKTTAEREEAFYELDAARAALAECVEALDAVAGAWETPWHNNQPCWCPDSPYGCYGEETCAKGHAALAKARAELEKSK